MCRYSIFIIYVGMNNKNYDYDIEFVIEIMMDCRNDVGDSG